MRFALQVDDQEAIFGPDDIVRGTVSLTTPGNVLVSEISVVFKSKIKYWSSPSVVGTQCGIKQRLLRGESILYSSEKTNPKPLSPAGRHEWAFHFRFPTNKNGLLPSFVHIANMSETISSGLSSHRVWSICYVNYQFKAHLHGTDLPTYCPTATEHRNVCFWPNRYTELPDGPWPKAHRQRISVPRVASSFPIEKDEISFLKKLRKKVTRAENFAALNLVAHIPRYNILGQPLQISLSISPGDGMSESPALTLEFVRYTLLAKTRIGSSSSSSRKLFSHVAFEQDIKDLATSFPEADRLIHLHTIAPVVIPFKSGWNGGLRKGKVVAVKGPLCPTFESELIARTYTLSLCVTVSCDGKLQMKQFGGGEIVLLSPTLDASVKKKPLRELGGDGIVEASGDVPRDPELAAGASGKIQPVELDGENLIHGFEEGGIVHGQELPSTDVEIENGCLTRSGEPVGDEPSGAAQVLAMSAPERRVHTAIDR